MDTLTHPRAEDRVARITQDDERAARVRFAPPIERVQRDPVLVQAIQQRPRPRETRQCRKVRPQLRRTPKSTVVRAGEEGRRTMSASSTERTGVVTSFRPLSRTLFVSVRVFSKSSEKPLSHRRSPSNPGAPVAGTNRAAANGVPCVIAVSSEPETAPAAALKRCEGMPMGSVDACSGAWADGAWLMCGVDALAASAAAAVGRPSSVERVRPGRTVFERKDDTQRAGPSAGGEKKDWPCARCVSGGAGRDGVGGMDGERTGTGGWASEVGGRSSSERLPCLCK